jgi:hypothetical protein
VVPCAPHQNLISEQHTLISPMRGLHPQKVQFVGEKVFNFLGKLGVVFLKSTTPSKNINHKQHKLSRKHQRSNRRHKARVVGMGH